MPGKVVSVQVEGDGFQDVCGTGVLQVAHVDRCRPRQLWPGSRQVVAECHGQEEPGPSSGAGPGAAGEEVALDVLVGRPPAAGRDHSVAAERGVVPGELENGSPAGHDPDAPDLAALVGELLVKSPDFGRIWGRYKVRRAGAGDGLFRHPLVGTIRLAHETLGLNRRPLPRRLPGGPQHPDHDAMVLLDRADRADLAASA
jgi:MmyB-like transcription regulator ligand binding domain